MKPLISIDENFRCIRIDSNIKEQIDITEAHSFLSDIIHTLYDFHKKFPNEKIGDYVDYSQDARWMQLGGSNG
jgi:hypothetical protein